jgi:hypothetical protein
MAFLKLTFRPGISRDQTDYAGEGGWFACDKIRFLSGNPQNIGGWRKRTIEPMWGIARMMHNWITTYHDNLMAIGTNSKLYLEYGGSVSDITPLRELQPTLSTPDTDNCVYTAAGQALVSLVLAAHGTVVGNFVNVSGVVGPIGGIPEDEINGNHQIIDVANANTLTFATTTVADATVNGAGGVAITVDFEIDVGTVSASGGYGWGTGPWGRKTWGSGADKPISITQRDWFYDNFDNDLVANIRLGGLYYWARGTDITIPPAARAISMQDQATLDGFDPDAVPSKVMQIAVSQQDKHLLAFGAVPYGSTSPLDFDPLLIRWTDQDSPTNWTPDPLNSAGDIKVSRGSKIMRGLPTRQEILVWTDAKLYTLQFTGTTDVFAVQEYADNISVMSARAMITASNITYWMGRDKFYAYTGRVDTLPCTLRDHVFNNIDLGQSDQVVCGTNEQFNEVWWFYPTSGTGYNDSYVVYDTLQQIWHYGTIDRSAWLDSPLRDLPSAIKPASSSTGLDAKCYLMSHETGFDDEDQPMHSYIQSSDYDLGDGDSYMLTRRLIPDFTFRNSVNLNPKITLQIRPRNFPGDQSFPDTDESADIFATAVGTYTRQVFIRARARQMAFKISCDMLGVSWSVGVCRIDGRQDGKR